MIYHSIGGYLEALEKYKNAPCKISNGVGLVLWDETWMNFNEFNKSNTIPTYEKAKKENPNETRI